jgi:hypothetical protein
MLIREITQTAFWKSRPPWNSLGNAFLSTSGETPLTGPDHNSSAVAVRCHQHHCVAFTTPKRQGGVD